jgi:hypothetical protein
MLGHATDNPSRPRRHVTVLRLPPVISPQLPSKLQSCKSSENMAKQTKAKVGRPKLPKGEAKGRIVRFASSTDLKPD